jgi:DNA-binding response OmpR family regulator
MKLLIVDDDPTLLDFFTAHLPARGFVADVAADGLAGLSLARVNEYDLIVLDINLPSVSGEDVCRTLTEDNEKSVPPILMLTAVADTETKVRLFAAGADDFLTKPFSFDEFLARVRALVRRANAQQSDVLLVGDVALDLAQQVVRRGDKELRLTQKEFALLEYLMRNRGRVVAKSSLIEHVWNSMASSLSNVLETHMVNLRRKLGNPSIIQTIHSRGYRVG